MRVATRTGALLRLRGRDPAPSAGARLTAWELLEAGIEHAIITDGAAGHSSTREIDLVLVGCGSDCRQRRHGEQDWHLRESGRREGKRVPFYVAARRARSTSICVGREDPYRGAVSTRGAPSRRASHCPEGKSGPQSRFDVTPAKYITGIIPNGDPEAFSTPVFRKAASKKKARAKSR